MNQRLERINLGKIEEISSLKIVLIGPPGSGKSTLVRSLKSLNKEINYISVGEITRRNLEQRTEVAKQIQALYETNQPWPDEFVLNLVLPELLGSANSGFILDGLPRKLSEVDLFVQILNKYGMQLDLTLNIFADQATILRRIDQRNKLEGTRPENPNHYKTRIEMYWSAEQQFKEVLGSVSRIINLDSSVVGPEELIIQLINSY